MDKKYLIMSVDDEADIRESVRTVLEDEGFEVVEAENGQDCLDKLKKIKPDLILLDVLMPGLTTKDIIKGVEKSKNRPKVIFLTVVKLSETTKKGFIKGAMVDYIEKPFDNNDLVKRVKKALKI
jgi:DNA-binding response OmpR family regulator